MKVHEPQAILTTLTVRLTDAEITALRRFLRSTSAADARMARPEKLLGTLLGWAVYKGRSEDGEPDSA